MEDLPLKGSLARLVFLIGIGSAAATAAPIFHTIDFIAITGVAPTAGSFTYDPSIPAFTAFSVTWRGIHFDLTDAANAPFVGGVCDVAGGTALDSFAYLFNPTCGSGERVTGWQASSSEEFDHFTFRRSDGDFDFISIQRINGATGPSTPITASGTFAVSNIPEPTSMALFAGGLALLACAGRRRK